MRKLEEKIILETACPSGKEALFEDSKSLDWPRILHLAKRHHLVPALHELLVSSSDSIPAAAMTPLSRMARDSAISNLAQTGRLIEILERFEQLELRVYPYKGPMLAQLAYGSFTKRAFRDLDLLVPESEVLKAARALESLGYRPCFDWVHPRTYIPFHYEYRLAHSDHSQVVELKWRVCSPRFRAWNKRHKPWKTYRAPELKSLKCYGPCKEELFVILVIHGTKHCWSRLMWMADLHRIAQQSLDWTLVLEIAESRRSLKPLALALHLLEYSLGQQLPKPMSVWANRHDVNSTRALIEKGWFDRKGLSRSQERKLLFSLLDSPGQKLEYVWGTLFYPTPSELLAVPAELPTPFLYFFVRPIRYLAKFLGISIFQDPRTEPVQTD